jgi:hypothetical protein
LRGREASELLLGFFADRRRPAGGH